MKINKRIRYLIEFIKDFKVSITTLFYKLRKNIKKLSKLILISRI